MKLLLTGADGQLGKAVQRLAKTRDLPIVPLSRTDLDITDRAKVQEAVRHHAPSHIVNAAAYTAVDRAESEPEQAYAVNRDGAAWLAEAAQTNGCRLLHISTDFVFDGEQSRPYKPEDTPNPINVYGASKLAGEKAVLDATHGEALVLRTAWVYSLDGKNFLTTMLGLMRERDEIRVVADQVGSPTATASLAYGIWKAAHTNTKISGILHWTDAGVASWYDLANMIHHYGLSNGRLQKKLRIVPVGSEDFPTRARRPSYSVLDLRGSTRLLGETLEHWIAALRNELNR